MKKILDVITLKSFRAARQRKRYDELKSLIVKEHLAGKGGMIVPWKFTKSDLEGFGQPMYFHARTEQKGKWHRCLFWRKDLMDREVGKPNEEILKAKKEAQDQFVNQVNQKLVKDASEIAKARAEEERMIEEGLRKRNGVAIDLTPPGTKGNA